VPGGDRTLIRGSTENKRSLGRENEAADILSQAGYKTTQNPDDITAADELVAGKNPGFRVEGKIFDCYPPAADTSIRNVYRKVKVGQTRRIVINLADWDGDVAALRQWFDDKPIADLDEVLVITKAKRVVRLYP
jgi:Contact-dependent growth inhibition CdiA C-terminal domain